jgi:vacuolar-type H+-ATPase subunit C/Vma6
LLDKNLSQGEVKSLFTNTYLGNDFKPAPSYLRMQINLDITAARNIYNSSSLISDQARKEFQEIILKRIAVLTVIWSYRLRVYYHRSEKNIRLNLEKLNNLLNINAESQIRSVEEDLNQHIEKLRKGSGQEPSVVDIEQHLEQSYYLWLSSIFHRDFHSIYCVIAYLWLLLYQIKNLFRIIDGRCFGFSADAILSKIICKE